jgi:Ankyrin repeats (3 copies)
LRSPRKRWRGDFNATSPDGIGLDITRDVLDQLRKAGVPLDDATLDGGRGIRIAMAGHAEARQLIDAADDCDMPALNKLLVEKKLNANARVPGVGSALMGAAESNCIEAARALINAGADIDSGFPGQGTPLSIAAANGSREMVQLLLDRGAKVDASMPGRNTPLVEAIREGDLAIVKALVDKGANISRESPVTGSLTPLDIAERHGEAEIAAYLRSKGAVASNPSTY